LALIASINADELAVSVYAPKGSLYIAEDSHYAKTKYVVYLGAKSVTVVAAGWSPETAELLTQELGKITDKPIENVVIPDHDPEYAAGIAYFPKETVLYAGSILKEQLGNLAPANLTEYPRTLQKRQDLRLKFDNVISGH
jgi:glyoxylase-like metal-dependent hydrolase (beta-lactamase superfamily II)